MSDVRPGRNMKSGQSHDDSPLKIIVIPFCAKELQSRCGIPKRALQAVALTTTQQSNVAVHRMAQRSIGRSGGMLAAMLCAECWFGNMVISERWIECADAHYRQPRKPESCTASAGVRDFSSGNGNNTSLCQAFYDLGHFIDSQAFLEKRSDRAGESLNRLRFRCGLPNQSVDDDFDSFLGRLRTWHLDRGNITDSSNAASANLLRLQELDQWIVSSILGDDVKDGGGVRCGHRADAVSDVKVQCIRATAGNLEILGSRTELLQRRRYFKRHFGLIRAHEHHDSEVILFKQVDRFRLDILKVDQDYVGAHASPVKASKFPMPQAAEIQKSTLAINLVHRFGVTRFFANKLPRALR